MQTLELNQETQQKLKALYNTIELGQGNFTLILIQTLDSNQAQNILKLIKQEFEGFNEDTEFNVLEFNFAPSNELFAKGYNTLDILNLAKNSATKPIDLMFITGLESLFGEGANDGHFLTKQAKDALQPINMGRIFFEKGYLFPVIFCLSSTGMQTFLRVPDFSSCRSLYLKFDFLEG